jgi:hypothetical protein
MVKYDVTKLNVAIDRLLMATQNSRHRFLLQAYSRHRYLEVAGRYEELFASDMMAPTPCYHLQAGRMNVRLEGRSAVESLYGMLVKTNQSIFFVENEQVAVADNFVASTLTFHQQVSGKSLALNNALSYLPPFLSGWILRKVLATIRMKADENAMYLYSNFVEMVWSYDDRGRLVGEDIWEPNPDNASIVKLYPADVLTTAESAKKLAALIKPLPSFDETVLGGKKDAD